MSASIQRSTAIVKASIPTSATSRAISAALRERGADELTARLGAEVGMLAFTIAVERWMESDNDEPFSLHAAAALNDLQVRAADLDSRARLSAWREFSET